MDQVAGPDPYSPILPALQPKGYSQFFFGGAPGVAEQLRDALTQRYPGLKVVAPIPPLSDL